MDGILSGLIIAGAAALVLVTAWAWHRVRILDCPRCGSLNTKDLPEGATRCNDCQYEWGDLG